MPSSIAETKASYQFNGIDTTLDDDGQPDDSGGLERRRRKFHLLITTNKTPNINTCRTVLSAAVIDYPPPTLINYGKKEQSQNLGADIVQGICDFLIGNEVRASDIVLIIHEGMTPFFDFRWCCMVADIRSR